MVVYIMCIKFLTVVSTTHTLWSCTWWCLDIHVWSSSQRCLLHIHYNVVQGGVYICYMHKVPLNGVYCTDTIKFPTLDLLHTPITFLMVGPLHTDYKLPMVGYTTKFPQWCLLHTYKFPIQQYYGQLYIHYSCFIYSTVHFLQLVMKVVAQKQFLMMWTYKVSHRRY